MINSLVLINVLCRILFMQSNFRMMKIVIYSYMAVHKSGKLELKRE